MARPSAREVGPSVRTGACPGRGRSRPRPVGTFPGPPQSSHPRSRNRLSAQLSSSLSGMGRIEALDQRDLIAPLIVLELIDEPAGEHDAEASLAEAQFVPQLDVANGILVRGGVREIPGI